MSKNTLHSCKYLYKYEHLEYFGFGQKYKFLIKAHIFDFIIDKKYIFDSIFILYYFIEQ